MHSRSEPVSGRAPLCSIAANIVGTPSNTLTRSRATISSAPLGREPRNQRQTASRLDRGVEARGLPERVKQRQGAQDHIVGREVQHPHHRRGVVPQVGVRQLGALRRAGGARRVEDHGGIGVSARDGFGDGRGRADEFFELTRDDRDAFGPGGVRACLSGRDELVPGEHGLGRRVGEVEGGFAFFQENIHRHHHPAGAQHAVVGNGEVGDVGQHDADPVAGTQTPLDQQAGQARAGGVESRVRDFDFVEAKRYAVGLATGCRGQVAAPGWSSRHLDQPRIGKLRRLARRSMPSWIAPSTSS